MTAALILAAYAAIGVLTTRNTFLRVVAYRRSAGYRHYVSLDGGDIAFVTIMAGVLWPMGWPTSFTVYPALWWHKRPKRGPRDWDRVNGWVERKLDGADS